MKKIDLMHRLFDVSIGNKCKGCAHLKTFRYHDKTYCKCEVYGITRSEASDWRQKYDACGLYPDKSYTGIDVIELSKTRQYNEDIQVEGQISLF